MSRWTFLTLDREQLIYLKDNFCYPSLTFSEELFLLCNKLGPESTDEVLNWKKMELSSRADDPIRS